MLPYHCVRHCYKKTFTLVAAYPMAPTISVYPAIIKWPSVGVVGVVVVVVVVVVVIVVVVEVVVVVTVVAVNFVTL